MAIALRPQICNVTSPYVCVRQPYHMTHWSKWSCSIGLCLDVGSLDIWATYHNPNRDPGHTNPNPNPTNPNANPNLTLVSPERVCRPSVRTTDVNCKTAPSHTCPYMGQYTPCTRVVYTVYTGSVPSLWSPDVWATLVEPFIYNFIHQKGSRK